LEHNNCPHCNESLCIIKTTPLSYWGGEFIEVCLNDQCEYFLDSWRTLARQVGGSFGYRYFQAYQGNGNGGPLLVGSKEVLKDCVISEEDLLEEERLGCLKDEEIKNLLERIQRSKDSGDSQLTEWLEQLLVSKFPCCSCSAENPIE